MFSLPNRIRWNSLCSGSGEQNILYSWLPQVCIIQSVVRLISSLKAECKNTYNNFNFCLWLHRKFFPTCAVCHKLIVPTKVSFEQQCSILNFINFWFKTFCRSIKHYTLPAPTYYRQFCQFQRKAFTLYISLPVNIDNRHSSVIWVTCSTNTVILCTVYGISPLCPNHTKRQNESFVWVKWHVWQHLSYVVWPL